jgi:lysophospholipase L1-like esterase
MLKKIGLAVLLLSQTMFAMDYLLIGDSMAEGVDKYLKKDIVLLGHNYDSMYKRGTQTTYWIQKQELKEQLVKRHDLIMISLGTNDLAAGKSPIKIVNDLNRLMDIIRTSGVKNENIVLITPPTQNDNGLEELILKTFSENIIVESKKMNLEISRDGVHPTMNSYKKWSKKIIEIIKK